ncbi:MAG: polysaccharide export protein [Desulfobacteraceae bacterium]|nr:polysaccharide export protein [Desulfobacteraceae bacterium]
MNLSPHRTKLIFLLSFLVFSTAMPVFAQQAGSQMPAASEQYILGAGDVVDIMVYGEPEISHTVFIRIDGKISLPLAGEVSAAGITPAMLAEKVTGKLERFLEDPNVTVILAESRSKVYYILGQVESPGEYPITRPVTVLQAIAQAGGFLEWAQKDRIMIVGGPGGDAKEGKVSYFNYDRFLKDGAGGGNVLIQPGDTIVIP